LLLQAEGQYLLGDDVPGFRWRHHWFRPAARPQQYQGCRTDQSVLVDGEEQAVAGRAWPPAGTAKALEEGSHGGGRVDLDDAVQVAYVDAELQGAGRDDHTVACFGEGSLCSLPFVH